MKISLWVLGLRMVLVSLMMSAGLAIIIAVEILMITILTTISMNVVFWFILGGILLTILIKNFFNTIPEDDDRIVDRFNEKQQSQIKKQKT